MLSEAQFNRYVDDGYNRIPFVVELLADLETPLSTYLKFCTEPYGFLLESLHGGETWGRYSIIGLPCTERLEITGNQVRHFSREKLLGDTTVNDPLETIREFQSRHRVPVIDDLPRFSGGLVGYFGYNTIHFAEPAWRKRTGAIQSPRAIDAPDIVLMLAEELIVFDNLSGRLSLIVHANPEQENAYDKARERLHHLTTKLHEPLPGHIFDELNTTSTFNPELDSFTQEEFKQAVERCLDYIRAGDAFQIVLSQRMKAEFNVRPIALYRALRTLNPSPYMFFMDFDDFQIASSSPEILARSLDGEVTLRPLAGTRKRGATAQEDLELEEDLLADPKELAEHLMLIDLGRNDVGRVSKFGSVEVTEKMRIERYSHVMHIVSNVIGELRDGLDGLDVLKASFPAGTLSGAPKLRALEIIEELEPDQRGIYSGAIGYLGWHGNMDTAIAIRTAIIKDKKLYVQAGAGIVADSVPENEWQETLNKSRAIFAAAELACRGFRDPL